MRARERERPALGNCRGGLAIRSGVESVFHFPPYVIIASYSLKYYYVSSILQCKSTQFGEH